MSKANRKRVMKQLTKAATKSRRAETRIQVGLTQTDLTALGILRASLGTPDATRTVRACIKATTTMVLDLMRRHGFTTAEEFRYWWMLQQQTPATETGGADAPTDSSSSSPGAASDGAQPVGGADAASETTVQDVSAGASMAP